MWAVREPPMWERVRFRDVSLGRGYHWWMMFHLREDSIDE
jgi:hypothetical protein